ncbi:MAG: response regulator transcription factor [Clostridiaceae bacterium]|nr:response regulator transcription factor [Clostridiaceae bacterium]
MRLLLVEDEPELRDITVRRLRSEGYIIDGCGDGLSALDYAYAAEYDAIILDIMLPEIDGLEVLKRLRQEGSSVAVLLLTARDSIEDRVKGLDAGADDYLVKPFSFAELTARIRALTRRKPADINSDTLKLADLEMDLNARVVRRGDKNIILTQREFALLEVLLRNKEIVLTRERIEQQIYDFGFEGGSNVIDVYIRYLRKKIDQDFELKLIHTVRGTGYVLRAGD